jgi:FtsP/CotA-like multicopper oxidase with cupredoxin domain
VLVLTAAPAEIDLAGTIVSTWAYSGSVPGPLLRATAGERVTVQVTNGLPEPTSVHWHGLAIDNAMDGVPGLTTPETGLGETFTYDFVPPDPGTHWFHPHHGLQLDRGLYGALIIDDPDDPGDYDREWVLVFDDWTDGIDLSPDHQLQRLRQTSRGRMGTGMHHGSPGDVDYPLYLLNGRAPADPDILQARPGDRVKLRLINAAADTVVDITLTDHTLTVTHTDGFPTRPRQADTLRLGMGERVDALVTAGDGAFAVIASPVGKTGSARAVLRTGAGTPPPPDVDPTSLDGPPMGMLDLSAATGSELPAGDISVTHDVDLSGPYPGYLWAINGQAWPDITPMQVSAGELVGLRVRNHSMMPHPMHLHGHTAQVGDPGGPGPRKDTVLLPPMSRVDLTMVADNPGSWLLHCHNAYHAEAGMMTRLDYT